MKNITLKQRLESKLFNGYVVEPMPAVILAIVVGIAFIVLALWVTCDFFLATAAPQSTMHECVIIEYQRDGPTYILKTDSGYSFDMPTDSIQTTTILDSLIANHTTVLVEYVLPTEKSTHTLDLLCVVDADGEPMISRDKIEEARAEDGCNSLLIMWSVCLCYVTFLAGSYYILCNAPKYPRLASILVREPYRNF